MTQSDQNTYLNVPYSEKDRAKELGAFWDPHAKKWFVPRGKKLEPFKEWLEAEAEQEREKRAG